MPCRLAFPHPRDVLDRMLVKVVLSYYMEGEHSQGASNPRVLGSGSEVGLCVEGCLGASRVRCLRLRRVFRALDSAKA